MPFNTPAEPTAWVVIQASVPDTLFPSFIGAIAELCGIGAWALNLGLSCELADQYSQDILDSIIYIADVPPWLFPLTSDGIDNLGDSNGSMLTEG